MKITVIGAGKTGRGFLARLLIGHQLTFIDENAQLVKALNDSGNFAVEFFGNKREKVIVSNYEAYTWEKVDKIDAEVIFVSVGGSNLVSVGHSLKPLVDAGQKIIVCENASNPDKTLFEAIGKDGVKIAKSTVFCTTIEKDGIDIFSEDYPYLQYDADALGVDVGIPTIKPVNGFGDFLTRKLFVYNSASCIIAYLGYLKGYSIYSEAANDPEILAQVDKNYQAINSAVCKEYGYDEEDQREFALLSRNKFTDKTISDTVERNAREPQRKITAKERVVGPLLLEEKYKEDSSVLKKTLAAMLLYTPEHEVKWLETLREKGKGGVLTDLCGIEKGSPLYEEILLLAQKMSK